MRKGKDSEVAQLCLTLRPHGPSPTRFLCPWDFPGKSTRMVAIPSPGDVPDPGIEPGSPALQADALPSEPPGRPMDVRVGP